MLRFFFIIIIFFFLLFLTVSFRWPTVFDILSRFLDFFRTCIWVKTKRQQIYVDSSIMVSMNFQLSLFRYFCKLRCSPLTYLISESSATFSYNSDTVLKIQIPFTKCTLFIPNTCHALVKASSNSRVLVLVLVMVMVIRL